MLNEPALKVREVKAQYSIRNIENHSVVLDILAEDTREERREGRIEGQKEGRERINELNRRLLKDGREVDILKSLKEPDFHCHPEKHLPEQLLT